MAHPSQDQMPSAEPILGGPSAAFTGITAALNDKLDQIAQQIDQLEHCQDAAEHHSDEVAQQLQLLLQWAQQCDEAE